MVWMLEVVEVEWNAGYRSLDDIYLYATNCAKSSIKSKADVATYLTSAHNGKPPSAT